MSIRDIIEAAVPCSVCADDLRSTCESLGQCKTRDAWRRAEREVALMEAERVAARELIDAADEKDILRFGGARIWYTLARKATDAYRKERGL